MMLSSSPPAMEAGKNQTKGIQRRDPSPWPHHGAGIQPLDAVHDLSLALLAAALLAVDAGVPQLLHDLVELLVDLIDAALGQLHLLRQLPLQALLLLQGLPEGMGKGGKGRDGEKDAPWGPRRGCGAGDGQGVRDKGWGEGCCRGDPKGMGMEKKG